MYCIAKLILKSLEQLVVLMYSSRLCYMLLVVEYFIEADQKNCGNYFFKASYSKPFAMSDISTTSNQRHRDGLKKSNRLSTRVDLTPMVDLGFLLITFFIFTTSMSQPKVMRLVMPDDSKDAGHTQAPAPMTFTFILGGDHDVYYYNGIFNGELSRTNFNKSEIRTAIQRKMNEVEDRYQDKRKTIILIKLTNESAYVDIVNALDEMLINGVTKYMLLDADAHELTAIKKSIVE